MSARIFFTVGGVVADCSGRAGFPPRRLVVHDQTAPESAPYLAVTIGNVKCRALIDTGSRVNIVSRELYEVILGWGTGLNRPLQYPSRWSQLKVSSARPELSS